MEIETIPYLDIVEFTSLGSGVLCFSQAPDSLPLLTTIDPLPKASEFLQRAAQAMGVDAYLETMQGTPLESLERELEALFKHHLIQNVTGTDQLDLKVMVLPKLIRNLTGPTLLEKLFGAGRTTPAVNQYTSVTGSNPDSSTVGVPVPPLILNEPENIPQPKFKQGQRCLALSLQSNQALILNREKSCHGWPKYSLLRGFLGESMAQVGGEYWYERYVNHSWEQQQISVRDQARYQAILLDHLQTRWWRWCVPCQVIAELILQLVNAMELLHQTGEIHGDLKPANILLTVEGVVPIDSLGLSEGIRSTAMTKGWAAPEQVVGLPMSFQTDQYAIGLMLLKLLEGVLYGEVTSVLIPTGGTHVEQHQVLKPPLVYIDQDSQLLEPEGIPVWSSFIRQCLCFDASQRFSSMKVLGEGLSTLLTQHPLKAVLIVPFNFGKPVKGRQSTGKMTPCWLVD